MSEKKTVGIPSKRMILSSILEEGYTADVYVKCDKARVPDFLKDIIMLNVGLNLPVPISGLDIDRKGFRGFFSFTRIEHWCDIPWEAVPQIDGQIKYIWLDEFVPPPEEDKEEESKPESPKLRLV